MEMKHAIWAMAGITGVIALIVIGVAMSALLNTDAPPAAPGGASAPANAAQDRVLRGFNVVMWGDGRPFVRVADPVTGEEDTVNLLTYLMFEPDRAESGYAEEGGYAMKRADPQAVENTFRLALCHEHGLFGLAPNAKDALHFYRIAAQAGHAEAQAAAQRLGGGR